MLAMQTLWITWEGYKWVQGHKLSMEGKDGEAAQQLIAVKAWNEIFQRREPVATPCEPKKNRGRSKQVNAPIEEIGAFTCLNDAEVGINENPIDLNQSKEMRVKEQRGCDQNDLTKAMYITSKNPREIGNFA